MKRIPYTTASVDRASALRKKFRLSDFLAEKVIKGVAFTSIAGIALIFVFVFREAVPVFSPSKAAIPSSQSSAPMETYGEDSEAGSKPADTPSRSSLENETAGAQGIITWRSLLGLDWQPVSANPRYGLAPLFWGSFKVTMVAMLFGAPLGILAALFSAAFAPRWAKEILKPLIELLAGIPSVVVGFFALIVLASFVQTLFGNENRLNAFVGGLALSLAVIPIVYTVAEDALAAVPRTYTEASLALGASKWQTILFVVLPAATPGVLAAVLLGFGRALGETMIVLMATGNASLATLSPFDSVRTLSATIGAEMAEVVFGDTHYTMLFLVGSLLFILTFCLNAVAEFYVRQRLMKKFRGGV